MRWREREKRREVSPFAAPKLLKPRSCVECKWERERERERKREGESEGG